MWIRNKRPLVPEQKMLNTFLQYSGKTKNKRGRYRNRAAIISISRRKCRISVVIQAIILELNLNNFHKHTHTEKKPVSILYYALYENDDLLTLSGSSANTITNNNKKK